MRAQIAWGALFGFLTCMFLFGFGARSWWLVGFAAVAAVVCCWGFGAFTRETPRERRAVSPYLDEERPVTAEERAEWAAVSPYFERGDR